MFSGAGANVAMHKHPGGHELGNDDVAAAQTWIREHVANKEAR